MTLYLFLNNPGFMLSTVLVRPHKDPIPIPETTPLLRWFTVWDYYAYNVDLRSK